MVIFFIVGRLAGREFDTALAPLKSIAQMQPEAREGRALCN
jgi:hypothetical protein